jgi:hypothetical protein
MFALPAARWLWESTMIELDEEMITKLAPSRDVRLTEDRAVTMLGLAMISVVWFFIGAAGAWFVTWMVMR